MRNGRFTRDSLIIIALTAAFSLVAGRLADLGTQILGSGSPSTLALLGDVAGLIACAASARHGLRHLSRSRTCRWASRSGSSASSRSPNHSNLGPP
jgi:hypothetical protein